MQGVNCVKGEIHSVLTALRIHNPTRTAHDAYSVSDGGGFENPWVRKLKDLYEQLTNTDDLSLIDTVQVFEPFLSVVVAENTNAIVTDAALQAIHKFMLYGHVHQHSFNAAQAMSNIGHSVAQCKFDAVSEGEAEVVYMKSLEVLVECLRCPAGPLLTDDAVCAMVTQCFAVRSRPNISRLLRRHADNSLLQMVLVIFARLSPDTQTGGADVIYEARPARSNMGGGGDLIQKQHTSAAVDVKSSTGSAFSPIGHRLQRAETRSSVDFMPYGVNTMQRVLKFMVKLMDRTRATSTTETLELGCRLVRTAFETAGSRIGQLPSLVQVIQDELCKRLLQNSQTKNLQVLSLTLRIVYDLFNAVKQHLKVQLEVFFTSIHMRIGESDSSTYGEKELVLESLVEFCSDESLIVGLYRNYDCEVSSTNLFEDLCKFLAEIAMPLGLKEQRAHNGGSSSSSSGGPSSSSAIAEAGGGDGKRRTLERLHVLSLEGVLGMLHSLSRRFGSNSSSSGTSDDAEDNDRLVENMQGGIATSEESKRMMSNRRRKQDLMRAAKHFNTQGYKAFKYIESLGLLSDANDPKEVVKFLRNSPGLDKKGVGELLGGSKEFHQKVMKEFISTFNFPFPKTEPYYSGDDDVDDDVAPPPPPAKDNGAPEAGRCHQSDGENGSNQREEGSGKDNLNREDAGRPSMSPPQRSPSDAKGEMSPSEGRQEERRRTHFDSDGVWKTGRVDRGLRAILETFHLSGEAQQIARILEEFSAAFYRHSPGPIREEEACYVLTYAVMMLHTDAHNPRVAKKMKCAKFVSTLRGTNKGKNFPAKYLEDIYDEITTKEIKVLNSDLRSASGEARGLEEIDASWQMLVERSRSTGPFQVRMAHIHGKEMFMILWTQIEGIVMHYFDHPYLYTDPESLGNLDKRSRRNERRLLLNKIVHGLYAVAKLCSVYNMNHILDKLVARIARRLQKQLEAAYRNSDTLREGRARFGRNRRGQKLAHLLFDLLSKYGGRHALEAWEGVVDCILEFHRLGLLPEALLESDDFTDTNGKPLPSLRKKISFAEAQKAGGRRSSGGGGVLGFIASSLSLMWTANESDDEDDDYGGGGAWSSSSEAENEHPREEHKLAAVGKACVATYGISALFKSTKYWASASLTHLLGSLLKIASLPVANVTMSQATSSPLAAAASTSGGGGERANGAEAPSSAGEKKDAVSSGGRGDVTHSSSSSVETLTSAPKTPDSRKQYRNLEETACFCLERIADVLCANSQRAFHSNLQLWRPVISLIEKAFRSHPSAPSYFTERAVVNALRLSIHMYPKSILKSGASKSSPGHSTSASGSKNGSSTSSSSSAQSSLSSKEAPSSSPIPHLIQVYALINTLLSPQAFYAFGLRIVGGIRVFARSNFDEFSTAQWQVIFKTYQRLRYHPKAANGAFEDLSALCKQLESANLFRQAVAALCSYFPPAQATTTWVLVPPEQIFQVLLDLHQKIPKITREEEEEENGDKKSSDSQEQVARHTLWLYSVNTLASLTKHPRHSIKELALSSLRTALLASGWSVRNAETWKHCISKTLVPMLSDLAANGSAGVQVTEKKQQQQHQPPLGAGGGDHKSATKKKQIDLRLAAATLLFQTFLQHMTTLSAMDKFDIFWLTFLGSIEKFMRPPKAESPRSASQLHVHVTEHFKNLLLVMAASGTFKRASQRSPSGQDLLTLTWAVLERFRPDLRRQLQELAGDSQHAASTATGNETTAT